MPGQDLRLNEVLQFSFSLDKYWYTVNSSGGGEGG